MADEELARDPLVAAWESEHGPVGVMTRVEAQAVAQALGGRLRDRAHSQSLTIELAEAPLPLAWMRMGAALAGEPELLFRMQYAMGDRRWFWRDRHTVTRTASGAMVQFPVKVLEEGDERG